MQGHRLVVAPRSGLRRAPNKRYRIYESEYSDRELIRVAQMLSGYIRSMMRREATRA